MRLEREDDTAVEGASSKQATEPVQGNERAECHGLVTDIEHVPPGYFILGRATVLWLALVYTLGLAVGPGLMGRITDIFGRRWFMVRAKLLGLEWGGTLYPWRDGHVIGTMVAG
ncbi:uncharacterized protein Z519_12651 [Cladophialophora bantiana CBS 173.52]|uniref:Major facilitator superfamily (MFS) profile domain-containing protein n=1 Tax=Cladophialophora bantiana (strain ATCC 10958 / CBS 173.52 / CDC B-1940 / NIH 8579) TaxID=1442370 RepID=A0A0D2H0D4_CLAB1|nr:uncharacterized protein Z519_12651 [Cladophialophora bantiana CBS 173.52]KIW86738.1 hypothetical protein Z519_12651 [Cladophialophora bantiana CBS 173.52]